MKAGCELPRIRVRETAVQAMGIAFFSGPYLFFEQAWPVRVSEPLPFLNSFAQQASLCSGLSSKATINVASNYTPPNYQS